MFINYYTNIVIYINISDYITNLETSQIGGSSNSITLLSLQVFNFKCLPQEETQDMKEKER